MNRRHFLNRVALGGAGLALSHALKAAPETPAVIATPIPSQLMWQRTELVAMFHYDLHLFDLPGEKHKRYDQAANRTRVFPGTDAFNPTAIDVEQWVRCAVDMGAKAAVMTACHENGLRLWQSDANPYSLKTTKWGDGKRDLVREFADACRKHGIKPGFFHCQRWNSLLRVHNYKMMKDAKYTQEQYTHMLEREIEELTSRYGELFMLWFDGGALTPAQGGPNMLPIFEKNQPNAIFYHSDQRRDLRWAGNEEGVVGYPCWSSFDLKRHNTRKNAPFAYLGSGEPDGPDYCPALADMTLRGRGGHEWFWEPGDERLIYPVSDLMHKYECSVGRNATLVIGITPDNRGLVPDADVARIKEFGAAIRARYGSPLASGNASAERPEVIEIPFPSASRVNAVVFGEETKTGERVRKYAIEARRGTTWTEVAKGTSVGHKRIARFKAVECEALRIRITASAAKPILTGASAFAAE